MSVDSPDVSVAAVTALIAPVGRFVDARGQAVADRFERIMGRTFTAMFAPALFDEMMHPAVSASLVDTDRIRADPFNRDDALRRPTN